MARIRTIKPEFWADEKLGPLDPLTRLVFLGLISQADDAGRLIDSVRLIDGLLFPYDDSTTCRRSLDELSRIGVIKRGKTRSGQAVIQIVNWSHQKIDRPNLSACLDPISEHSTKDRRSVDEGSSTHIYDLRSTINDQGDGNDEPHDAHDPWARLSTMAVKAIRGLYGWDGQEGTDAAVWRKANGVNRDQCLTIAVTRLVAEEKAYNGRLFRRILESVIEEQKDDGGETW